MTVFRKQVATFVSPAHPRPAVLRYGLAVGLPVVALAITSSFFTLGDAPFFPLFTLAVVVVALYGGRDAGLVATFISVLLNVLAAPPALSFAVSDPETILRTAVFALGGVVVSLLVGYFAETQRVLERERARLFTTLASIGDAVIATDLDGNVQFLNGVAEEATGWSSAEADGMPLESVFRIVNEQTRQATPNPVRKVFETGKVMGLANHTVLIRKDGSEIPIEDSAAPIRDLQGNLTGVVLVFRDVSHERKTQSALMRAEKLATVGRLAATIAHEMNNPLAALANLLYLIETSDDLDKARAFAKVGSDQLHRAAYVTKQTLSFAKQSEKAACASLAELTDGVLALYENKLAAKNVTVHKRFHPDANALVTTSECRQVIANLLSNAIDAVPYGGSVIVRGATASWHPKQQNVRLTVADTGHGIPADGRSKLFEAFYTTKQDVGTGLGLWVAQTILTRHDGCIHVRSRVGKGTVFVTCWPKYIPERQQKAEPTAVQE